MPILPTKVKLKTTITLPQARMLYAIYEQDKAVKSVSEDLVGTLTRSQIAKLAGVSESMTGNLGPITLNKLAYTETSRKYGRRNLLDHGYVKATMLEINDGVWEIHYSITAAGIKELERYLAHNKLPKRRDKELCINDRYQS